jgi:hypothetical protein
LLGGNMGTVMLPRRLNAGLDPAPITVAAALTRARELAG